MFDNLDDDSLSPQDSKTLIWFLGKTELSRAFVLADALEMVADSTGLSRSKLEDVLLESKPSGEITNLDRHLLDQLTRLRRQEGS